MIEDDFPYINLAASHEICLLRRRSQHFIYKQYINKHHHGDSEVWSGGHDSVMQSDEELLAVATLSWTRVCDVVVLVSVVLPQHSFLISFQFVMIWQVRFQVSGKNIIQRLYRLSVFVGLHADVIIKRSLLSVITIVNTNWNLDLFNRISSQT